MAQATVTDYFSKKRKGYNVPAAKRPKISLPEDEQKNDPSLSKTTVQLSKKTRTMTRARTKRSAPRKAKDLVSYFSKVVESADNNKDESTSTGTEQTSSSPAQKSTKIILSDESEIQIATSSNEISTTEKEVNTDNPLEKVEPTTVMASTSSCSRQDILCSNSQLKPETIQNDDTTLLPCANAIPSSEEPDANKVISNTERPDIFYESYKTPNTSEKNNNERFIKVAEKLQTQSNCECLKNKLHESRDLKGLQDHLREMIRLKKELKQKELASKIQRSPVKATPSAVQEPLYQSLHSLAQDIPAGLPLPNYYKVLLELFRCLDIIAGMFFNRKQVATWANLQKSVQEMSRRNFEIEHLAQIKTVFPSAYQYRQEKGLVTTKDRGKQSEFQLTIEPVFEEIDRFGGEKKLTGGILSRRRHHFHFELLKIVREHHAKFLTQIGHPSHVSESDRVRRWHKDFPLDSVPNPKKAELPQPPVSLDKRLNAKDVLEKARSRFTRKAYGGLKKVTESTPSSPEKVSVISPEKNNNVSPAKATPAALKGIPQSLLDKVRAKEAARNLNAVFRSDEQSKKLEQLDNLPQLARALRMLYMTEKRASLSLEFLYKKLAKCTTSILSEASAKEHIMLLVLTVPEWLESLRVKNSDYIKMNRDLETNVVLQKISVKRRELADTV